MGLSGGRDKQSGTGAVAPATDATRTTLADWDRVTLYYQDRLVWGTEPGGCTGPYPGPDCPSPTPTPLPTPTITPIVLEPFLPI
ncbi:MAG: hypothetical protein ACLFVO_21825 [Chloroflexaceae bacterium]